MPERYPPEDPREWLNRARSNLVLAKSERQGVYLEDLCFNTQQAVEKAVKALLIKHSVEFPYVDTKPYHNECVDSRNRLEGEGILSIAGDFVYDELEAEGRINRLFSQRHSFCNSGRRFSKG